MLIALCKNALGNVRTPNMVDFVQAWPRSPIGKVLKKGLRDSDRAQTSRAIWPAYREFSGWWSDR